MAGLELNREVLRGEALRLVRGLQLGSISESAYDTAWVARVPNPSVPGEPLFRAAHDWLLSHQNADGSWGSSIPFAHDRLVSTLAALLTLSNSTYRADENGVSIRRATVYLNRSLPSVSEDFAETVGFELLLPTLSEEAQRLGMRLPYESWKFVEAIREVKMRGIPPIAVYGGPSPLTHSFEFLGNRLVDALAPRCRLPNGSYGISPSATAYIHLRSPGPETLQYLQRVTAVGADGGVPYVYPFELFETSWVLFYLSDLLAGRPEVEGALSRLESGWTELGAAWTGESTVPDADDTAVCLLTLQRYRRPTSPDVLALFEAPEYFQTFTFERNPSITTNAHVLLTLRDLPTTEARRRMTLKTINYLEKSQLPDGRWIDKWHASPYYAIHEVALAMAGIAPQPVRKAVQWILEQQHENGAWGFEGGTVEETAWAISTLLEVHRQDIALAPQLQDAVLQGLRFVQDHFWDPEFPALWIGKTLYTPRNIVRAALLSAAARAVGAGIVHTH